MASGPGRVLAGEDRTLLLAHAAQVKNVPGRKSDVADAVWLSDPARARPDPPGIRA
jgi:hypothetical protein